MKNVNTVIVKGLFMDGMILNVVTLEALKGSELKSKLKTEFIDNDNTLGLINIDLKFMSRPEIIYSKLATEDSLITDVAELLEISGGRYFTMTVSQAKREVET